MKSSEPVPVRLRRRSLTLVAALALCGVPLVAGIPQASGAKGKGCASFGSQKAAQRFFVGHGGSARRDFDGLDPDHDGLVCPKSKAPFAAYVEIGFNKSHGFFYGTLTGLIDLKAKNQKQQEACQGYPEMKLAEVRAGVDPVVASRSSLPIGAKEMTKLGRVVSTYEWKLEPKSARGTFYAFSEDCYGTRSARVRGK